MTREEAIAQIREAMPTLWKGTRDAIQTLIPELAESDDERIRKEMIDFINHYRHNTDLTSSQAEWCKKVLAYLEKQKEQKFTEKQDYSDLTDLERAIHRGFLVVGVENVPVTIIKETAQDCLSWMKPAEWSEEDERMRNQLIYDVEYHKKEGLVSAKQNKATEALYNGIEKCYDEKIAWLKSLRPQPHWKPSEEQMRALNEIICLGEISYVGQEEELIALRNKLKKLM